MTDHTNQGGSNTRSGEMRNIITGVALIIASLLAAYLIASLVDLLRPGTLIKGRDFRPAAWLASGLVAVAGCWCACARGHRLAQMLASLLVIEMLICGLLFIFTGNLALDGFFLNWLAGLNMFLGLPWLIGIGIGLALGPKK